jgi:hypothetical protein
MIFGEEEMIQKIGAKSTFFFVDATFGVVPGYIDVLKVRSSQVLNIVADYGNATVNVATVIMSCRKVALYRKIFAHLRRQFPCINPRSLMCDWEAALRKTLAATYPNARTIGCW